MVLDHHDLSVAAVDHFGRVLCDLGHTRLLEQLKVIQLFPRLFSAKDSSLIGRPLTVDEVETY